MEYKATFGIDCGVSFGLGVKYPDYVKEEKLILANSHKDAYQTAMNLAIEFADNYLSNPNTNLTVVQLLSLKGPDGLVSFDPSKSLIKRHMLEHLLSLVSKDDN